MADWDHILLVDGENLDMTLGSAILRERPRPEQRPRWERVLRFAETSFGGKVRGLFFLNVSYSMPYGFLAALQSMGFTPVPLVGPEDRKIVDEAILRTLTALQAREGGVLLGSHDSDFAPGLAPLLEAGRRVGLIGFTEMFSSDLRDLPGVELFDLEDAVGAFDFVLPRMRAIDIDAFDPARFL